MATRKIKQLSETEIHEIGQLYELGEPIEEIGRAFHITGGTVSGVAIELCHKSPRSNRGPRRREVVDVNAVQLPEPVEFEGGVYIRDVDLGLVLGYRDPTDIRRLIVRKLGKGPSCYRSTTVLSGGAAKRLTTEYLLNQEQANLVILHCKLPNADAFKALVAKVFTAWQQNTFDTPEMEIGIADAVERVVCEQPDFAKVVIPDMMGDSVLGSALAAYGVARVDDVLSLKRLFLSTKRRDLTNETKAQHIAVIGALGGNCPCCGFVKVVEDGKRLPCTHFDHWSDNSNKNGLHETWLICANCNLGFNNKKLFRENYNTDFNSYQRRLKAHRRQLALF